MSTQDKIPKVTMNPLRVLFYLFCALLVWKIFCTDWIVEAPYWWRDIKPPASDHFSTARYVPPSSPIWKPPTPEKCLGVKSWGDSHAHFGGGGTYGITAEPILRLNWKWMGFQISAILLLSLPFAFSLSVFLRKFRK